MKLGDLLLLLTGTAKVFLYEYKTSVFPEEILGAKPTSSVFEHYKDRKVIGIDISDNKNFCITLAK